MHELEARYLTPFDVCLLVLNWICRCALHFADKNLVTLMKLMRQKFSTLPRYALLKKAILMTSADILLIAY